MTYFYAFLIVTATLAPLGCIAETSGGAGGGGAATTTTITNPCATIHCQAPQMCGGGCATDGTVGCYTPGGNPTAPGHWDCPSCFPMFASNNEICASAAYPYAFFCQSGAAPLGGCVESVSKLPGYECCPAGVDGGAP